MIKILVLSLMALSANAFADTPVDCSYAYDQAPMGSVTLQLQADGTPEATASYNMYGSVSSESVTPDTLAAGELVHVWLDKEDPDNSIEMIVYVQPTSQGQSELINHNVPIGQDVWGTCTIGSGTGQ